MIIKKMYEYVFSSETVFHFVLNNFIWIIIMKIHLQEFCPENYLTSDSKCPSSVLSIVGVPGWQNLKFLPSAQFTVSGS